MRPRHSNRLNETHERVDEWVYALGESICWTWDHPREAELLKYSYEFVSQILDHFRNCKSDGVGYLSVSARDP